MLRPYPLSLFSVAVVLPLLVFGCNGGELHGGDEYHGEGVEESSEELREFNGTVEEAARRFCSTGAVRGLALEIVDEIRAMRPGLLEAIDGHPQISLAPVVIPYLQAPAARALRRALERRRGSVLAVNSVLRTLPQQYLLYRWYQTGRCGIPLAAPPGRSNHETALAIDIESHGAWRNALEAEGFSWLGSRDPVHFDYVEGGSDLRTLSVLAFQRLWNRHHPEDRIAEDGIYGAQTESRLRQAPAQGFGRMGPRGGTTSDDERADGVRRLPIAFAWRRDSGGAYTFTAQADRRVEAIDYVVDGHLIGRGRRAESPNFAVRYTFQVAASDRKIEVNGYDARGRLIARGVGLIDTIPGTGVYVRMTGDAEYEIGLERAPAGVAAIEVDADGFPVVDGASGARRSTRLAVQSRFNLLGRRNFEIRTYGSDGRLRGTLRRSIVLE